MRARYGIAGGAAVLIAAAVIGAISVGTFAHAERPAPSSDDQIACTAEPKKEVTIAAAKLIIEFNSTDFDIGVHGGFDDHGWSELCVYDPSGAQVLAVKPQAQLKDLTMAGIFFESREPPAREFSFEDLKDTFPEGQYTVRGVTFEGKGLTGSATFTHDVPTPPAINAPVDGAVVPTSGLVVEWEDVTETIEGAAVTITGYEIIITKLDAEDPNGFSTPTYDVHVPPDRNSLSVPAEFLDPSTEYELEVLALEESGNQTIAAGFFETE